MQTNLNRCRLLVALGLTSLITPLAGQVRIGSSSPSGLLGGHLEREVYFSAGNGQFGAELWQHPTTTLKPVVDIYTGLGSSYPTEIIRTAPFAKSVWFVARERGFGRELHHYPRLSGARSTMVRDIQVGANGSYPRELTTVGSRLYFSADDGRLGRELWTSDGTIAGTRPVADLVVGRGSSQPQELTSFRGRLFFVASTPTTGTELFVSDGTAAKTTLFADLMAGKTSSTPNGLTVLGDRLYFAATTAAFGRELWCTDGTLRGTRLVADLERGKASSNPDQIVAGANLAFTANTRANGRQLYVKTPLGGPVQVTNLANGESISHITPNLFDVWFRASTAAVGAELWRSTNSGMAALVADIQKGKKGSKPANLVPFETGILFRADDGRLGQELYKADAAGVKLVTDIRTGEDSSRPSRLIPVDLLPTRYLFAAKQSRIGIELWQYDKAGGTRRLLDIDKSAAKSELHVDEEEDELQITITDAEPGTRPVALAIGIGTIAPLRLGFLRGALVVDFGKLNLLQILSTNGGRLQLRSRLPSAGLGGIPLVYQAFTESANGNGALDATTPGSCTTGVKTTPGGAQGKGVVCVDDESGEYKISTERLDSNSNSAFIGVYRVSSEPETRELLYSFPLEPGSKVERDGRLEFKLRMLPEDAPADFIEVHIFDSTPTPDSATSSSLIVASYC